MEARVNALSQETPDRLVAGSLAVSAGLLAAGMRREGLTARSKANVADVVTAADSAAEELVRSELARLRPRDAVLGEEGTLVEGRSGRRWVIDPVDGTYNFFSGAGPWCSALALEAPGGLTAAVFIPDSGELFTVADGVAMRGSADDDGGLDLGAELERLDAVEGGRDSLGLVSGMTYLHPAFLGQDEVRRPWESAVRELATVRMLGSGSVELSMVADGRAGVWFQHSVKEWDWLPGKALVEAAGGVTARIEAGGVVWSLAGRAPLVEELAGLLAGGE